VAAICGADMDRSPGRSKHQFPIRPGRKSRESEQAKKEGGGSMNRP
jgi:hypothetical protein